MSAYPRMKEGLPMPVLLLPTDVVSLSSQAVNRLLEADNGDASLLYLALVMSGGDEDKATEKLRWSGDRLYLAREKLASLDLVTKTPKLEPSKKPAEAPPEYTRTDMASALEESEFKGLLMEMERLMGRIFTEADMKKLYTIYDFYNLPAELILTIANYTIQEERKSRKNQSYVPMMSRVLKEARKWKQQGIDTADRGEEYLRKQEKVSQREWEILSTVGVQERRAAVGRERTYVTRWIETGYSMDLIRLAYETTIFRITNMSWEYMDSILRRWELAGYRTVEEVQLYDKPQEKAPRTVEPGAGAKKTQGTQPSQERIRKADDWMDAFLDDTKDKNGQGDGKKE